MPFQVSPGVNVSEIDLTGIVPAVSTAIGALAGRFSWGPMGKRILVDSEEVLEANFGKPDNDTAVQWLTAADFLSYANQLWLVRADNVANNATAAGVTSIRVLNEDDYDTKDTLNNLAAAGAWAAKYPGTKGNSIKVSVCQGANTFESIPTVTWLVEASNTSIVTSANVASEVSVNDYLYYANSSFVLDVQVSAITSNSSASLITVATAPTEFEVGSVAVTTATTVVKRRWEYYDQFDSAPGTSAYASTRSGANDEMHIMVIDEDGAFTGIPGNALERYAFVSRAFDAKTEEGGTNYYKTIINNQSKYAWWTQNDTSFGFSSGTVELPSSTTFVVADDLAATGEYSLSGASDGETLTTGNIVDAYDLFADSEEVDVSLIIGSDLGNISETGDASVASHLIQNICEVRKDCITLISPRRSHVVDNSVFVGAESEDIVAYRNLRLPSSSYGFMDSGWKYTYDKYNDVYRYIPLNGATAGTMALTDTVRDPWWSPAGYNRGNIRNIAKLAYNPRKAQRDELYKSGVNPVVTFPGEGTVLYGDKTMLTRPSAFDRVNVRRLFIILEKSISTAAKYTLFEFNDAFTRAQFRNLVEPFLRDVQGRRGIFDFRVVCDETNNTPEVIDRNEFVGDIYIKPARSINFIQLNFVAVRTGVDFEEVVGQF